jgi:hypothetical protein
LLLKFQCVIVAALRPQTTANRVRRLEAKVLMGVVVVVVGGGWLKRKESVTCK